MIKVYVMSTCPDCFKVKSQLQDNPNFQLVDLGEHVHNLKEFIRLRDNNPVFDPIKEKGYLGILVSCWKTVLFHSRPKSSSLMTKQTVLYVALMERGANGIITVIPY